MQRGNTLSSVNDKPTLSDQVGEKEVTVDSDTRGDYARGLQSSIVISESKTFTPFVKMVRSRLLLASPFLIVFSSIPDGYACTQIHICVRMFRVAFTMQNSPARRSLIMHSARRRCATIESSGRVLRCARSSARIDFPRDIFAMTSAVRVLEDSILQRGIWTTSISFGRGLRKTLNCGIIVSFVIFSESLSLPVARVRKVVPRCVERVRCEHSHKITQCKYTVADISK